MIIKGLVAGASQTAWPYFWVGVRGMGSGVVHDDDDDDDAVDSERPLGLPKQEVPPPPPKKDQTFGPCTKAKVFRCRAL